MKASLSKKATLSCEVSDSTTEVKWYKDGKLLASTKAVHMESKARMRELVIEKMDRKDAGEYTCEAGTQKLLFKLQTTGDAGFRFRRRVDFCSCEALKRSHLLSDAAVKFQKKPGQDAVVVNVSENVNLTTELTAEGGGVKWFRDGVELKECAKYELRKQGSSRTLIVKAADVKDSGTYSCHTADDKVEFKVQVKGKSLHIN